jgi:pimeloyl-ACP methyl ester carboxylesterase
MGEKDIMNGNVKSADGVSIAYRVEGSGNPTLVFIHGGSCDKSYWDSQVSYFAQKYRVVAVDLAGHGESGLDRDRWTMAAFGEDVTAVVNHLNLEQIVLIGHSMGGAVILEAAQRIHGVLGIIGVDQFMDVNSKVDQAYLDQLAALRSSPDEVVRAAIGQFVSGLFIDKSDPTLVEKITLDMSSEPMLNSAEEFHRYDLGQALEKVTIPVWCISSDYHPFDLEAARQHCPSFEVVFMSGVGHFVMMEDPETFNTLLEGIVRKLAGR